MQFTAASNDRLMGQLPALISMPNWDWTRDASRIAARALDLVANDPFAAALVTCKLNNTHGPEGLVPVSLAQTGDAPSTDVDRKLREKIEKEWRLSAKYFDATGQLSRKAFDRQIDDVATVMGECFAVRVAVDRKYSKFKTAWRVVRPERVNNPNGENNSDTLYHGLRLNRRGEIVGIYVETTTEQITNSHKRTWAYIPWFNKNGTPNIIHRFGWRIPGMLRGVSMFAPMLLLAKQLGGTIEAHVTGKRAQACNPVIYYVDDPEAAAKAARADPASVVGPHTKFNPLQVYYAKFGNQVQFTDTKFNGADLDAFLRIGFRVLCATWQIPVEVVLCQMGEAALASARAGLDQVDRTAQDWQNDHIEQVAQPAEINFLTEIDAFHNIPNDIALANQWRYRRPPKYSTDRLKDAQTIKQLIEAGLSTTSAFSLFGYDYEDEVDQDIRDELYKLNARTAAGLEQPKTEPAQPETENEKATEEAEADDKKLEEKDAVATAIINLATAVAQQPPPSVVVNLTNGGKKIIRDEHGAVIGTTAE